MRRRHGDSHAPESDAGEALLAEHGERVYRFCVRLCDGDRDEAADLAQDVLVAAWRAADGFRGRSTAATWLYRIAVNRWTRLRRRAAPSADAAPIAPEELAATTPDPADAAADRLDLARALAALPPDLRAAFLLVKAEGLKYREAAAALGVPLGTVQGRVHEAGVRLRAALAAEPPAAPSPSAGTTDAAATPARKMVTRNAM